MQMPLRVTARVYTGEDLSGGLAVYRYNSGINADKQYLELAGDYTAEVKNLVQALYGYYVAAEAYAN